MDSTLISFIAALTAVLISFMLVINEKIREKKEAHRRKNYSNKINVSWNRLYKDIESSFIDKTVTFSNTELSKYLSSLEPSWRNLLVHSLAYPEKLDEIESQVKKRFDELKKRVEEIENRFPKEATLEKIASVNDAILATNLEALSKSIKEIKNKLLTKYDVVKIFFELLAAIGVLIGLIFAILRYIAK